MICIILQLLTREPLQYVYTSIVMGVTWQAMAETRRQAILTSAEVKKAFRSDQK